MTKDEFFTVAKRKVRRFIGRVFKRSVAMAIQLFFRILRYPRTYDIEQGKVMNLFWDFQSQPYALGDIITWNVKMCVAALNAGKKAVNIHILAEPIWPSFVSQISSISQWNYKSHFIDLFPAFYTNPLLRNLKIYHHREDFEALYASQVAAGAAILPDPLTSVVGHAKFNILDPSGTPILEYQKAHGDIPRPTALPSTRRWAKNFFANYKQTFFLCLHMRVRESGGDAAEAMLNRDGNVNAWIDFLNLLKDRYPDVLVVALGRPAEWPKEFFRLPNLVILKSLGFGLMEELAMIQECDLFMGTVSGPAEMAYFGVKPYVIIDTPENHSHSTQNRCIPESALRPPFGNDIQRLYYCKPDGRELLSLFEEPYLKITKAIPQAQPASEEQALSL